MRTLKIVPVLITVFFCAQILAQENKAADVDITQSIEENEIRHVVEGQYIKGLQTRNFELIKAICIPDAKLMGINGEGKLNVTTMEKWSKKFDPKKPPFKKLEYDILKIDQAGTAAQVKILFLVNSKNYITDFLHMLKIDASWRIVNIIDF